MHRGARPRGAFPRLWWQRLQCSLLALLEGQEWLLAGSSVLAHPRRLQAPHAGVGAHGDQTVPTAPGEEARPGVRHAALHLGLVLGMLHAGGIDQEAVVAGELAIGAIDARVIAIRLEDAGRQIVGHHPPRSAPKELQGRQMPL